MISAELMRKVRRIQIRTRRAVNDALAGEYLSVFKGHGIEFEEVRDYVPGDDIRSIDWNVTARTGAPSVKRYREERQLTVVFLFDASASGLFGSRARTKGEIAAEICALIAFSAIRNNDRVGLLIFTDAVELYIPPQKGQRHAQRIVREVLAAEPKRTGTNIAAALEYLLSVQKRRAVVFVLSDFIAGGYERMLAIAARKHDMNVIRICDPHEDELPNVGMVILEDAESGEVSLVDTSSAKVRIEWSRRWERLRSELSDACKRSSVGLVGVGTDEDYVESIITFFSRRERERRLAR